MDNTKKNKQINIDYRENALIQLMNGTLNFNKDNLAIGDIIFKTDSKIDFCFERKTVADLASSIKDGRYHDQLKRILECVPTNRCCYIIEGKIPEVERPFNMPVSTIYGSIINKMFRDNIFIVHTNNLAETARFIKEFGKRYLDGKLEYDTKGSHDYVQNPRKKGNITSITCFSHQLSMIPSISSVKINAIIEKVSNMRELVNILEKDPDPDKYLENIVLKNGRKLGKSSANKILQYLGFNFQ